MAPPLEIDSASDQLAHSYTALKQQFGSSPYGPIRHLVCQMERGRIRVQGTVSSFYLKQIARSLAASVAGVDCVHDEIEVQADYEINGDDAIATSDRPSRNQSR